MVSIQITIWKVMPMAVPAKHTGQNNGRRKNAGDDDLREIAATDREVGTVGMNRLISVAMRVVVPSRHGGLSGTRMVGPSSTLLPRWSVLPHTRTVLPSCVVRPLA